MRVKLAVTDDGGNVFEGEVDLSPAGAPQSAARRRSPASPKPESRLPATAVDLRLPVRAFMSRYARGRTGPQAFALLLARLAEGEIGHEVSVESIRSEWNRTRGIVGSEYATMYATRAKDNAWVDSPRRGVFVLLPDWPAALTANAQ